MQISACAGFGKRKKADVLILPFWQEAKKAAPACQMKEFSSLLTMVQGDFEGREGETLFLYTPKKKERRLLLLGLGKEEELSEEGIRRSYAAALKAFCKKKIKTANVAVPEGFFAAQALEGMLLANYRFDTLKSEQEKSHLQAICFIDAGKEEIAACKRMEKIVEAVNFARDLINGNADDITPQKLSSVAKELEGIKTTVFDKKRIEKEKMGLLLAVNRGSTRDPAFILMEYRGDPGSKDVTALIGKGITYDTGGLNLKPTGSMETMKDDMSGAAVVLGTMQAAAKLKLKVNLIGAIASTENAIGPDSYKPGDVYKSYEGTTVEIANTDAEGRLVLADALAYVRKHYNPSRMINFATLTGAIVVALGDEASGLFSNDDGLAQELQEAGEKSGDRLWRMPLYPEYKEALKSSIADIKNSGDRKASSCTAAIFLKHFVKETPWAHIDIAGTAFFTTPKRYHPTNATGVGVRLLVQLLSSRETI